MKKQLKTFFIDLGNSSLQYSILGQNNTFNIQSIETKSVTQDKISELFKDAECIICSVVPEKDAFFGVAASTYFVDHSNIPKVDINIHKKEELGADRIVTALAAYQTYGESIIIDSGTAITCCYIDANGVYQGGAILPGLKIASQSLNNHTSKVPLIYVDHIDTLTGKSTKEAVQVGLYHGYRHLINGLIADYKQQFPNATVVGTGSGLDVYQDYLDIDHYDSELIFKGLYLVYNNLK